MKIVIFMESDFNVTETHTFWRSAGRQFVRSETRRPCVQLVW